DIEDFHVGSTTGKAVLEGYLQLAGYEVDRIEMKLNADNFTANWQRIIENGVGEIILSNSWNGTSDVSFSGTYTGLSPRQITFLVEGTEGGTFTIGTDATVSWSDGVNKGTVDLVVGDNEIADGVVLECIAGDLIGGESFSLFVHPPAYRFRMSINEGSSWSDISLLNAVDFDTLADGNAFLAAIQARLNDVFLPGNVTCGWFAGPTGLQALQFTSSVGDVRVEPAIQNDLARVLMLGSSQGGLEISRYALRRPALTGLSVNPNNLNGFVALPQTTYTSVTVDSEAIDVDLQTLMSTPASLMYQDGMAISSSGGFDGIREKFAVLANAINSHRVANPTFIWNAQVVGNRLVLNAVSGSDNQVGSITTPGVGTDISDFFAGSNVRYYSLGPGGTGSYQTPRDTGSDGNAPTLNDLQDAFEVIDREVDIFNLMILPRDVDHDAAAVASMWGPASVFCQKRRAFLLMDPPAEWTNVQEATNPTTGVNSLRIGLVKDHSAMFFPDLRIREDELEVHVGPSGAIAGLMSRIDSSRGVWKAPAGTEADIRDVVGLKYRFSDGENGVLNPNGINTLRVFPNGIVSWGARTMDGADNFSSEWKYIPIRRLALFIEESLYRGLQWVAFEPNDEPLWAQIRLNVGAFMNNLFRQGAFQGQKRSDAYFVKCDSETTTRNDINLGIVNVWIGFAPLKPAEFVIIKLQQIAGQIEV
ncbi:MAG: phage tail sheath subtilisin-like domain-containing protein, partial [Chitinophagales bacterium]|nr:phage tail sheath subtilisin-like domain-containing protein [Chitinophagales bacterium]